MMFKKLSISAAASTVVASLIYASYKLLTPTQLETGLVVGFLTLIDWPFGIFLTGIYKKKRYPDPADWAFPTVKEDVKATATLLGGIPLSILLIAYFYPTTLFGGLVCVVYGFGIGAMSPYIHDLFSDILIPFGKRMLNAYKSTGG